MTHKQALAALGGGGDTLTAAEKEALDIDGYLPLEGIVTAHQAKRMRSELISCFAADRTGQVGGASESGNLQERSDVFDICFTHPRVLAAVAHVLREPFSIRGIHSRPRPPGSALQGLHVDYAGPPRLPFANDYAVCNSMWPLTDFTEENGATCVVPGSHRLCRNPEEVNVDPLAEHPEQVKLIAPVGTVIIFNGHIWHGGTANLTEHHRYNLTSFFARRTVQWGNALLTAPLRQRLSPAAQYLFARAE